MGGGSDGSWCGAIGIAQRQIPARMEDEAELGRGSSIRVASVVAGRCNRPASIQARHGPGRPQPAIDGEDGPAPSERAIYRRSTEPLTGAIHQWKPQRLGWTSRSTSALDDQPIQFPSHPGARHRDVGHQRQALACALVDHDQDAEAAAIGGLIRDEVEQPSVIRHCRHHHRRPGPEPPPARQFTVSPVVKGRDCGAILRACCSVWILPVSAAFNGLFFEPEIDRGTSEMLKALFRSSTRSMPSG